MCIDMHACAACGLGRRRRGAHRRQPREALGLGRHDGFKLIIQSSGRSHIGHNYIGHNYAGHNYKPLSLGRHDGFKLIIQSSGHSYIGHNYIGDNCAGHNYKPLSLGSHDGFKLDVCHTHATRISSQCAAATYSVYSVQSLVMAY